MLGDAWDMVQLLRAAEVVFTRNAQGGYLAPETARLLVAEASANMVGAFAHLEKLVRSEHSVSTGSKSNQTAYVSRTRCDCDVPMS